MWSCNELVAHTCSLSVNRAAAQETVNHAENSTKEDCQTLKKNKQTKTQKLKRYTKALEP